MFVAINKFLESIMAIEIIDQIGSMSASAYVYHSDFTEFHVSDMQSLDAPERLPSGGTRAGYATSTYARTEDIFTREQCIAYFGTMF